ARQRHPDQEPVKACPPRKFYRFKKLIRRNKIVVTAGALVMISLVAGLGDSAWMFTKERKALQRALAAEDKARKEQSEAKAASVKFQNSEREKNRNLYAAEMALTRSSWEDGQVERALDLLRSHIPKPGQEDLRGFEWRFLWGLCQQNALATLTGHRDYVQCIALSPDGQLLASGSGDGIVKLWDVASRRETGALQCCTDGGREVRSVA